MIKAMVYKVKHIARINHEKTVSYKRKKKTIFLMYLINHHWVAQQLRGILTPVAELNAFDWVSGCRSLLNCPGVADEKDL